MSGPFLSKKDIADLKKVEAIHNSKVKRGVLFRKGNEQSILTKRFYRLRVENKR